MGKKKRKGKQRNQNQLQPEGTEPDDSNFEPITETLPEAATPNTNNSENIGDTTIPSKIKDSLIPVSNIKQESSSKEHGKELPIPESEILVPNISKEKNDTLDNTPVLPLEQVSQVNQPTTSTVIELAVKNAPDTSEKTKTENNSSDEGKSSLKNDNNHADASETSQQQEKPKEIMNSTRPEVEETAALKQTSEEQSSEKRNVNIDEQGTLLNSPPESTIPSNITYPVKPSMMPNEEEHKITVKTTEEIPNVPNIPSEKSTVLLDKGEEESPIEKCLQNPNIPEKSGPQESKIKGKNDNETDSKRNADCTISANTTKLETTVDMDRKDLNLSCNTNLQKEIKDNHKSEDSLPVEKEKSVQHDFEQSAFSEGNSNEPVISSMAESKKSNKKNKKSNINKNKGKGKKGIDDKQPLSSDNCESSKTEELNPVKTDDLSKGTEPNIMQKPDFEKTVANTTLIEKTETPVCKIKPIEENVKPTDVDNAAVKDKEINAIKISEIKSPSQVVTEEKDTKKIYNTSSPNETGNNQIKTENNNTENTKNCNQVCSSSSEEKPDSRTISCSQSKEVKPVPESHLEEELEKKTGIQSSEPSIDMVNTENLNNPSLKGNKEVGKKHPNDKSIDKNKKTIVKNPSHQHKITTDESKLSTQGETVLDSFVDTNLNTMLSRNKKGMSKQKKNDSKRNQSTDKNAEGKPSSEDKHEVKNPEAVTKEESVTGTLQQGMKTISTNDSISNTPVSLKNDTNINSGNNQESHEKLTREGEGHSLLHTEDRVPARTIFMANTCHVCKMTHGGSTRLQTCSACRLITYCSKEHQKKHWKEHKSICHVVQNMVKLRGLTDLFSNAHKITDPDEWRKFRCILLTEAENYVGRSLLPYEREMFLYPRTCGKCHKSDPEKLKVCKLCHFTNFCCNEHIPSNHHIWCQDLKLLLEINQYQSLYGLIRPFIPNFKLNESKPFPKDMKDFIFNYISKEKQIDLFNLYEASLSDVASYPLTILYAINYLKERNFYTRLSNKLSIHLVGAESQFEADTLSKWDSFLINLLPEVVQLHLVFIGPELTPGIRNQMNCENYEIKNMKTIDPSKQLLTEFHYRKLYHEYAKEEIFTKPDIICAFNCGIYRFTGFDKQDTWGPTMSYMLKYPNTPIILTAYTAVEAPKDVERFQNQFKIKTLHNTARNPFSSMRPNLNFVSDDETPVIYKNQYLSIIAKGD